MRRINLQLFAEGGQGAELTPDETKNLTAEELKAQIAAANAKIAKLTNKADALASENAAKTKQLRERMSAEEREIEAKKEKDKRFEDMQRKLAIMETVEIYMDGLGMPKETAQQYAEAELSGDRAKKLDILKKHMASVKANVMQEFLRNRPSVSAGRGESHESKAVELLKMLPKSSSGVDENILRQYM